MCEIVHVKGGRVEDVLTPAVRKAIESFRPSHGFKIAFQEAPVEQKQLNKQTSLIDSCGVRVMKKESADPKKDSQFFCLVGSCALEHTIIKISGNFLFFLNRS